MSTIEQRIANLSPAKRALLEQHLSRQVAQPGEQQLIAPRPSKASAPLSFSQQRLWFLQQMEPDSRAFYNCTVWHVRGRLDRNALTRSLAEIVRRHAILRTRIIVQDGEVRQQIDPVGPFHLPCTQLQMLPPEEQMQQLQTLRHELQQQAYEFATDHPWRFHLAQFADDEHALLIAKHHIASDGWSNGIFQRELSQLYAAFIGGEASPLPPLPIDYADFALWQRAQLQGPRLAEQLTYWRQQLQNLPLLQLPQDAPRTTGQSDAAATHEFILSAPLTAALKALSKAQSATLYMTLLAVFKILLFRYSGQVDLRVGAPIAGRCRSEVEGLIGFFLNTLVLRSQLNPNDSFLTLLSQVRKTTLDAYAHQDVPIEKLIEVLQPERSQTNSPLFQVLFLLQNMPHHTLELSGLRVMHLPHETATTAYDLSCTLREDGEQIIGQLTYRCTRFQPATIARLTGHYQTLLESAVADPLRKVATLPILTKEEVQQQLVTWNQTGRAYPLDQSLIDLFSAQVSQRPEATAFLTEDSLLTYSELGYRVDHLVGHLCAAAVKKGTIVGVCLPRSFDAIVALLAIFKVGGIYLPLDPTYPRERLAFMLDDAQAPLVITNTSLQSTLPANTTRLLCIDNLPVTLSPCHPITLSPCHPNDPAYLIYTSGSTGQPKGALVAQRQILNRLWWMWRQYPFQPDEMSCQKTALNFVDSLWELLGPLLQGSPTVIIPDDVVRDPQRLVQSLAQHRVTRLWVVPTLLRAMLQSRLDLETMLPKLRFLVASGEPLPTELFQQVRIKLPHATLYNLYGTSEIWDATWYDPDEEEAPDPAERHTIPIGKPIDNVQCYILDNHRQPVPIGVTGELYIGGVGLADGYWNQTELTNKKFIDWPLPPATNQPCDGGAIESGATRRLYQTGDLARYHSDGNIHWMGRADFQIKLRGVRIELEEIEAVLLQHPEISDAVVVIHEDKNGHQQLAAYLIAASTTAVAAAQLRHYLHNHLPAHMVPATYSWMNAFPLTPSGKVNRKELPQPNGARTTANCEFAPARDELEMQLVQLWQKTLRIRPIGIHDNFFGLGGHSLLAVTLFDKISKVTGKVLPLSALLQAPTIAQQALLLRQQAWQPQWSSLVAVRSGGSKPPIFLVPPARGTALSFIKLAHHLDPEQPIYSFDPIGLDGKQKPLDTVEAIAAHYLHDLCLFQPEGPYLLGGMCVGAHIAFEMVRQLKSRGAAVDCLLILDAGAPANGPDWHWTPDKRDLAHYSRRLVELMKTRTLPPLLKKKWRQIEKLFNQRRYYLEQIQETQSKAGHRYIATPLAQQMFLVQSQQYANRPEHRTRWATLAVEGLIHHTVPDTTHKSLIATNDQHISCLAAHLQRHLDQLDHQQAKTNK